MPPFHPSSALYSVFPHLTALIGQDGTRGILHRVPDIESQCQCSHYGFHSRAGWSPVIAQMARGRDDVMEFNFEGSLHL